MGYCGLLQKKRKRKKTQNNPDQNQAKREQRGLAELFAQSVLIISSAEKIGTDLILGYG